MESAVVVPLVPLYQLKDSTMVTSTVEAYDPDTTKDGNLVQVFIFVADPTLRRAVSEAGDISLWVYKAIFPYNCKHRFLKYPMKYNI